MKYPVDIKNDAVGFFFLLTWKDVYYFGVSEEIK